ncbi:flagellar biosynthesis protein FlaG [Marinomonas piezotolerans]|uniref:Flagellar biosynthesis protein FlaG n=1 Tax=Marinomonas piezotolerans TaxID=2213058 RepID=A0A370U8Z3_9GAMM|nr:flagellar protein FlaG [Marinomonas piezotolerans]RDL44203.1 flagellar biosynthesis protein FlaG [Marinomonas piezotolerans]
MSIPSDLSKVSFGNFPSNQSAQILDQEFTVSLQKEAKVVNETADTNTSSDAKNFGNGFASSESNKAFVDTQDVEEINVKMRQLSVGLSFEKTEDGENNVVKVIDQETGDLVRQIPTEEFLEISKRLDGIFGELNDLKGNLVNSQV